MEKGVWEEQILKNIYNLRYILAKKILFLYNKLVGKLGYSQKERLPLAETNNMGLYLSPSKSSDLRVRLRL